MASYIRRSVSENGRGSGNLTSLRNFALLPISRGTSLARTKSGLTRTSISYPPAVHDVDHLQQSNAPSTAEVDDFRPYIAVEQRGVGYNDILDVRKIPNYLRLPSSIIGARSRKWRTILGIRK